MIRSRSIPAVLSRATGDGVHAVLLVDAAGELLGSCGAPPPVHPSSPDDVANNGTGGDKARWPLDAASIGALVAEVAGDYRRMGEELLLLDPQYDSQRRASGGNGGGAEEGGSNEGAQQSEGGAVGEGEGEMGDEGGASVGAGDKEGKKGGSDAGTNLKSLVIELDHGNVGVASAGPGFYVIALADSEVQHGALSGRLRSLGAHVGEALSQLD
ncbi:hypothetical protein ACHAXT_009898 [Thalassiosira profunda]